MVHPDYQYKPTLVTAMAGMIASGVYDVVLGSRTLGGALWGGMPLYKYVSNRILTAFENLIIGAKLSEYHTGFRGFRRNVIESLPLLENSDDFVFDNHSRACGTARIACFSSPRTTSRIKPCRASTQPPCLCLLEKAGRPSSQIVRVVGGPFVHKGPRDKSRTLHVASPLQSVSEEARCIHGMTLVPASTCRMNSTP